MTAAQNNNSVEMGISNLVFIPMTSEGSDSAAPTYSNDKFAVPGTVKITVDYDENETNFAADNNPKYYTRRAHMGNSGQITNARFPEDLKAKAYGWRVDSNGGLVELADGKPTKFAMGYQVEGDANATRVWHYNVTLGFPAEDHNTMDDDSSPDTQTVDWTGARVNNAGEKMYRYGVPEGADNYDTFLDAVALPAAAVTEP